MICEKYEHRFVYKGRTHGEIVTLKVNGDCFLEDTVCSICGLQAQVMYSNKHPEIIHDNKFIG